MIFFFCGIYVGDDGMSKNSMCSVFNYLDSRTSGIGSLFYVYVYLLLG